MSLKDPWYVEVSRDGESYMMWNFHRPNAESFAKRMHRDGWTVEMGREGRAPVVVLIPDVKLNLAGER